MSKSPMEKAAAAWLPPEATNEECARIFVTTFLKAAAEDEDEIERVAAAGGIPDEGKHTISEVFRAAALAQEAER